MDEEKDERREPGYEAKGTRKNKKAKTKGYNGLRGETEKNEMKKERLQDLSERYLSQGSPEDLAGENQIREAG